MRFNLEAAKGLLDFFGGEESDITVEETDGHSGHGLYAYCTDYPDEGSLYLGNPEEEL
jgi:hypothetical protein